MPPVYFFPFWHLSLWLIDCSSFLWGDLQVWLRCEIWKKIETNFLLLEWKSPLFPCQLDLGKQQLFFCSWRWIYLGLGMVKSWQRKVNWVPLREQEVWGQAVSIGNRAGRSAPFLGADANSNNVEFLHMCGICSFHALLHTLSSLPSFLSPSLLSSFLSSA